MPSLGNYIKNILISIDQLINALFGGNPDETLSSRAYKFSRKGCYWYANIINGLFFWQRNHCQESEEKDDELQ